MKRRVLTTLILTISVFSIYAQAESWMSLGYEQGNFIEIVSDNGDSLKSTMSSPGINLSVYEFYNKSNVGIFIHDSFLFPKSGSLSDGIDTINIDFSVYDFLMQIGLIIGPGFRLPIDEKLNLYYGVGLSLLQTSGIIDDQSYYYVLLAYNIGVGGNFGFKYDFNETMYLDVGVTANYDFSNYTSISSSYIEYDEWADNYYMISYRPYAAIGINLYRETAGLGKPK